MSSVLIFRVVSDDEAVIFSSFTIPLWLITNTCIVFTFTDPGPKVHHFLDVVINGHLPLGGSLDNLVLDGLIVFHGECFLSHLPVVQKLYGTRFKYMINIVHVD